MTEISEVLNRWAKWVVDITGGHTCHLSLFRQGNSAETAFSTVASYQEKAPFNCLIQRSPLPLSTGIFVDQTAVGSIEVWFDPNDHKSPDVRLKLIYDCSIAVANFVESFRRNAWLEHKAYTDELTQLYNHAFRVEKLPADLTALCKVEKIGIIYIDLDNFKAINDERDHETGNDILREFASIFQKHVREKSDYVVRDGGDEFLVVLTNTTLRALNKIVGEIKADAGRLVSSYLEKDPGFPRFGLSIGTLMPGRHIKTPEDALKEVDELMKRDKNSKPRASRYRATPQPGQIHLYR